MAGPRAESTRSRTATSWGRASTTCRNDFLSQTRVAFHSRPCPGPPAAAPPGSDGGRTARRGHTQRPLHEVELEPLVVGAADAVAGAGVDHQLEVLVRLLERLD